MDDSGGSGIEVVSGPDVDAPAEPPLLTPLVDGETGIGSGASREIHEPATGRLLCQVHLGGAEEIDLAVTAAARALALWRHAPFAQRAETLRRLQRLIAGEALALGEMIAREQGKPFAEAMNLEILPTLDHLTFMIQHAERYHAGLQVEPRHPFYAHKRAHYLYDAIGVIALITPAPLPFSVPMIQVAAALAMGNTVVLKPSEDAPMTALKIGELCADAGFPSGTVNVVPAGPEETLRLAAHERVDKVFFTGSTEAGRQVMSTAGSAPRPVVLCLGDKHATIVANDADLGRAAKGVVWGALANAGQNCGSIERVFVEESVASKFIDLVLAEADQVRPGNPLASGVDLGPMHRAACRDRVHAQVVEAVNRGARLMRGGAIAEGPGNAYPVTVLHDPPLDSALMIEETGGPVIPIVTAESLERALMLANATDYALSASAWTTSTERAERLMVGLKAGVVTINDVHYSYGEPSATWSGFKRSGVGQNHGRPGLREMSRQRFVSLDEAALEAPLFAYPYDEESLLVTREALNHLHGETKLKRGMAWTRLLRSKRFRERVPTRSMIGPKRKKSG